MTRALKPVWGLFFILLAVTAVALLMKASRPDEIIPWRDNYQAGLEEGRAAGKPVFLYFTATWCGPCQNLKHTTWADKSVDAALREYVPVKVDIDADPAAARQYGVRAIPAFAVLDADGKVSKSADGALPPARFVAWLKGDGKS